MKTIDRRTFVKGVGATALFAGLGPGVLRDLGLLAPGFQDADDRLDCGALEPLVRLMQETPADRIVAVCIEKLRGGTTLDQLTGAAALANARTFGGTDYTGFHCEMALMPALSMARLMPDQRLAALPLLKVAHRNATRIQEQGGREREALRRVTPARDADPARLLAAEREGNTAAAEATLAALVAKSRGDAFDALQTLVREDADVHQVVLSWRAHDLTKVVGVENALTMLRQSARHCVEHERARVRGNSPVPAIRDLLPRLLEEHRLDGGPVAESRPASDAAVDALAWVIFKSSQEGAARAVASALGSGFGIAPTGEALSLAAVRLLLHDPGATQDSPGKPKGCVHGASVGVHASDSANAWRHIAAIALPKTAAATMITAGWHTGGQSGRVDASKPRHAAAREKVAAFSADELLPKLDEAIRTRDQATAAALGERLGRDVAARSGGAEAAASPVLSKLLEHVVEADGALHHEKFFVTTVEAAFGLGTSRRAFVDEYLAGLARVAASGFGFEAPGLKEARDRLLA